MSDALKKKVGFYKNVQRILESLKMISAVRSNQYTQSNKYSQNFLQKFTANSNHFAVLNNPKATKTLHILITANKGLCGNYISSLNLLLKEHPEALKEDWIFIGHKLPYLAKQIQNVLYHAPLTHNFENITSISNKIYSIQSSYAEIKTYSWKMQTNAPEMQTLYQTNSLESQALSYNILSTDEKQILNQQHIFATLKQLITAGMAMEETRRLISMDQAVKNGDEILITLKRKINQARQQSITNELNEIISGKEYA